MAKVVYAIQSALRFARNHARSKGITLKRFKQISGWDSDLGPEWVAFDNTGNSVAKVYYPIGDKNVEQAKQDCELIKVFGDRIFGITAHNGNPQDHQVHRVQKDTHPRRRAP